MIIENILCHSFSSNLLDDAKVALDCGSNKGEFARWLSENTSAEIHSFEPDPGLYPMLPKLDRVTYHEIAVSGKDGDVELAIGVDLCSSAVYRESNSQVIISVKAVNLENFCKENEIDTIDFMKMDIEGAEISVFEGVSDTFLKNINQITIEFHDFLDINDVPKIKNIFTRMRSLGFFCVRFSHHTWGDCLFINKNRYELTIFDRIYIAFIYKYKSGLARICKKVFSYVNN